MKNEVIIKEHCGIDVARDDLYPGGTKRRILMPLISNSEYKEFAYPSTAFGAAMVAIAYTTNQLNKKGHIFLAERKKSTPFIEEMVEAGKDSIEIHYVKGGLYNIVKAAANKFCQNNPNVKLLPCGLNFPEAIDILANEMKNVRQAYGQYDIVISACSSGALQLALQKSELGNEYVAVGTGMKNPPHGKAKLIEHYLIEKFEKETKVLPPFPTVRNYDGKVWQYALKLKEENPDKKILMWNVSCTKDDLKRI